MRGIGNIFRRKAEEPQPTLDPIVDNVMKLLREQGDRENRIESFVRQVYSAPAQFNRATRRSVGMLSNVWRWDLNAHGDTHREFAPRYVRRHGYRAQIATNRRGRKELARVTRILKSKGMA